MRSRNFSFLQFGLRRALLSHSVTLKNTHALISIKGGTFFRNDGFPQKSGTQAIRPMFPNAYFALPSLSSEPVHWAVVGPSNAGKTTFLELLRGLHSCQPPTARTFPYLGTAEIECKDPRLRSPTQAIQYVGFNGRGNGLGPSSVQSAYMSARYESRREETDFSVLDYLKGQTELNSDEAQRQGPSRDDLTRVLEDLDLSELAVMPVANLSNGQTRRVRIAKALLNAPELLLLDEPFSTYDIRSSCGLILLGPSDLSS